MKNKSNTGNTTAGRPRLSSHVNLYLHGAASPATRYHVHIMPRSDASLSPLLSLLSSRLLSLSLLSSLSSPTGGWKDASRPRNSGKWVQEGTESTRSLAGSKWERCVAMRLVLYYLRTMLWVDNSAVVIKRGCRCVWGPVYCVVCTSSVRYLCAIIGVYRYR